MSDDTENKTRKPLPTTKRGRASQLPLGTGIGITGMTSGERYLMSGAARAEREKHHRVI
jgi:hypothetical protein